MRAHKREREDIAGAVDVKIEHGEALEESQFKGTFKTVRDRNTPRLLDST